MYNGTNTDWLRNRAPRYGAVAQTFPVRSATADLVIPAVRSLRLIPSWTLLAMIVVATTAVCATVIVKARSEFDLSASQKQQMLNDIETISRNNHSLEVEIKRLTTDSSTIELAARERLGMVMPSDIVVPIESVTSKTTFRTLSFVR